VVVVVAVVAVVDGAGVVVVVVGVVLGACSFSLHLNVSVKKPSLEQLLSPVGS
jgi:hypothetical protein